MRRTSTDASGAPRPVPFAAKFQRVHPGTTGVTVLEHLERLDAVEASLQRLGVDEEDEEDVGDAVQRSNSIQRPEASTSNAPHAAIASTHNSLPTVPEASSRRSSIDEEDLVALSKSTSHVEGSFPFNRQETLSSAGIEWMNASESPTKRVVISEVHYKFFLCDSLFLIDSLISASRNGEDQTVMFVLVNNIHV